MRKLLLILFCAVILIGCATSPTVVDRYAAGQPQEYREGFQAGYDSGNAVIGRLFYKFNKDVRRYTSDELYRAGWDDGFNVCKGNDEALGRALRR